MVAVHGKVKTVQQVVNFPPRPCDCTYRQGHPSTHMLLQNSGLLLQQCLSLCSKGLLRLKVRLQDSFAVLHAGVVSQLC
jgi:hypothetical protein